MTLEENIKQWINLDNNIKQLNYELKKIRAEKELYNNNIKEYLLTNNLNNAVIKIGDEQLRFIDINHNQPLSYKFICECLCKYYDNDNIKVMEIIQFIKSQREIKSIKEIKRFDIRS
jgi:hypothetical protein